MQTTLGILNPESKYEIVNNWLKVSARPSSYECRQEVAKQERSAECFSHEWDADLFTVSIISR